MKRKLEQGTMDIRKPKLHKHTILEKLNSHPYDTTLIFNPLNHTYSVKWSPDDEYSSENILSVTSFGKSFFPAFDSDKVIQKMMKSKNWKKSKYFGMSVQEIKKKWETQRDICARNGTAHHLFCENYYNGLIDLKRHKNESPEIDQFINFVSDHKSMVPLRTEWLLRTSSKYKICGTPDIIFVNDETYKSGKVLHLDIYDWKNSKKITKFGFEKGYTPLEKLPNSNYFHYSIQLNIYKYILETFYAPIKFGNKLYSDIHVNNMFIIVMHENRSNYMKMQLPNFQEEVRSMFEIREKNLNKKIVSTI